MATLYVSLKFVHVLAAIVWIGGVIAIAVVSARLARVGEEGAMRVLAQQNEFVGRAMLGPAAITTLAAGIALVGLAGGRLALWTAWGLVGVFGSILIGAVVLRRAGMELHALASSPSPDRARVQAARRRVRAWSAINIVLLISTVWAMVFKPTL